MKYKIVKTQENIISVVVPNDYERAMLFCRVQEFYESPCSKFRNNKFSIWDYYGWYSKNHLNCFSYTKDFVGFNLPLVVAKKCYEMNEIETPYDEEMCKIIDRFFENKGDRKYLIGVDSLDNSTFDHELAHAFYYTNIEYRNEMDEITKSLSKSITAKFKKNLSFLGYCKGVMKDEIQAYMATEVSKKAAKGIANKRKIHQKYKAVFKKYKW